MILAFQLSDIITIPFGYLLDWLYRFTTNYGVALILFAVIVQLVLLPITAKSKKSMMKMSRLTPRLEVIKAKYADDPQRQNQAMADLYKAEGVSMTGGCLWSFVPLLILLPLYQVIRQPVVYMFHESLEVATEVINVIKNADGSLFAARDYYEQIVAARHIANFAAAVKEAVPEIGEVALQGLNFNFLGIDLGVIPQFNVFAESWSWTWANIGGMLVPLLSAGSQVVSMLVSQKLNNSVITNEKGVQDAETAKKSQNNQTSKMMMWMMPIMSLWIGFTVPGALSLYWMVGGIVRVVEDTVLTLHFRKVYDAEDAVRLQKALEEDRIEAEKERVRAERRAANPEGITENTSKKKLQKKQQQAEAEAKAAAAREYAEKRGITVEEEEEKTVMSGIPSRPYCKGRAYDPNRYASSNSEE